MSDWTKGVITAEVLSDYRKYQLRSQMVHWHDVPACRAKAGRDRAVCILSPGHPGPHYGAGNDEWGPKNPILWDEGS